MRSTQRMRSAKAGLVTLLGVSLIAGAASYVPEAQAKPFSRPAPTTQLEKSTPGKDFVPNPKSMPNQAVAVAVPPAVPVWPAATSTSVTTAGLQSGAARQVGLSPVSVAVPAATKAAGLVPVVKLDVLSQADSASLGVAGVVMRLARTDAQTAAAQVNVKIDYSKFAKAFGGDWSTRLRLVELTCTSATACAEKRVLPGGRNDTRSSAVSADVNLPPIGKGTAKAAVAPMTVLALTAGVAGSSGSYAATPLAPSSTWSVGAQTGDFNWNYPFRVPPGTAGPRPELSIKYSSGSVDGQVASTNNQTSWIGQGHSLEAGFIERKYVSCADDVVGSNTTIKTGDLCWKSDNAVLNLGSHSGELVKVSSEGVRGAPDARDTFKLENDDGSRIERRYNVANGAYKGEYWIVTTSDGTVYYFGLNPLADATERTNSVNTVPVFGNHDGEDCYKPTFAASYCTQAWRWNVDRVVDRNDNLMTYRYVKETNYYGRNNNTGVSLYDRASYLNSIEYGEVAGLNEANLPPARIWFGVEERCIPDGTVTCVPTQLTATTASKWPDVPFDQICTSSSTCPNRTSPSFFTRKKLRSVNTQVLKAGAHVPVDTWVMTHDFPPSGDTDRSLWLATITHQGRVGGTLNNPSVSFGKVDKPNRVDAIGDSAPAMTKYRISSISSESGQITNVNYTSQQCTPASKPTAAEAATNTMRCFPVYWTIDGGASPTLHWFNKYLVDNVIVDDNVADAPDQATSYEYVGAPAWHFDDNELTLLKYRSWGDWRGYGKVNVKVGTVGDQSRTQYTFMRGMHGDYLDKAGTSRKTATVTDSQGDVVTDVPRLNGYVREQISYDGASGPEVTGTINTPWIKQTASVGGDVAELLETKSSLTRTRLSNGTYRTSGAITDFDNLGMPVAIHDRGDIADGSDDRCTRYTYNRNDALGLTDVVSREEKVSVGCGVTPTRPQQVISDERMYFDGHADLNAAPIDGQITKIETMSGWTTGPVYEQRSRTVYDTLGRIIETYDGLDRRTSKVTFTPATGGPVTGVSTQDAKGFVSSTTIEPSWGATTVEVDPNMRRTDLAYDAFGRLTGVWLPNRSKSGGATASMIFGYSISKTYPPVVATQELLPNGSYKTSRTLFDGLLRQRQVQTPAATGVGRVIVDTTYDRRGNVATEAGPYYDSTSAPTNGLYDVSEPNLPAETLYDYDGANRQTLSIFKVQNAEQWRTQTSYGGNTTTVIPPTGATTTTQVFDVRGKVSELRQYRGAAASGAYDSTRYTYTPSDQLSTVTNADGSVWRYSYDQRGRQTTAVDPDKGTTTSAYDDADRLVSTKDARGQSLFYSYDELDRKTAVHDGAADGTVLARWSYDTLGKGLLTSSTRTVDGNDYVSAITGYDTMDRPTGTRVVIPASEGKLAGTYDTTTSYNPDGTVKQAKLPSTPGLPDETIDMYYDAAGNLDAMLGWQAYVGDTTYGEYGDPLQYRLGQKSELSIYQSFTYEQGTRRLHEMTVDRAGVSTTDDRFNYTYDDASNVTSISHATGAVTDRQCFTTDYLRRTTEAWTPTGTCSDPRSAANLDGPAPYWQSYTYDASGNRTKLVDHKAAGDTTSTYSYPAATAARPHAVTGVTSAGPGGTSADTYGYDASGNMSSRTVAGDTDTFAWDPEGHLASVSGPAGDTSYIYDAEGTRLIRHDPKGSTLYLASGEVRLDKATDTASTTRYYDFNGSTVAMRTNSSSVEFLLADPHGTATVSVDGLTAAVSRRNMDPFGNPRGTTSPTWEPNARGFVNGVEDASTSLTHLGAREYDPKLGRFISVDPLLDVSDPITLNGYRYGNNSPATFSDPDGLREVEENYPGNDWTDEEFEDFLNDVVPTEAEVEHEGQKQAAAKITHHVKAKAEAKARVKKVIKDLVKIVADELGITDALNCFTDGDVGACLSTGITVLSSLAGGIAGKLLTKYLLHAKKAWKLVGRINDLIGEAIDGIKGIRKAEDDLRAIGCNSFVPGTLVLLSDGTSKPIEQLKLGDKVKATDPETGKTTAEPVVATITGQGTKQLVDIAVTTTSGTDGSSLTAHVVATDGHPFYLPSERRWVRATDLGVDDVLQPLESRTRSRVASVARYDATVRVHNLTIRALHTYYVVAGETPVLVHNCDFAPGVADIKYDKHVLGVGKKNGPDMPEYDHEGGFERYVDDAKRLMCSDTCPAGATQTTRKIGGVDTVIRMDASGKIGMREGNRITTYFRPDNPLDYFGGQAAR
jgi:RHS repeat-associated protein